MVGALIGGISLTVLVWIIAYAIGGPMYERWAKLMGEPEWLTDPRFKELPLNARPKSDAVSAADSDFGRLVDQTFVDVVVERWRGATSNRDVPNDPGFSQPAARTVEAPMLQPSMGLDPDRFSLLKKPLQLSRAKARDG